MIHIIIGTCQVSCVEVVLAKMQRNFYTSQSVFFAHTAATSSAISITIESYFTTILRQPTLPIKNFLLVSAMCRVFGLGRPAHQCGPPWNKYVPCQSVPSHIDPILAGTSRSSKTHDPFNFSKLFYLLIHQKSHAVEALTAVTVRQALYRGVPFVWISSWSFTCSDGTPHDGTPNGTGCLFDIRG